MTIFLLILLLAIVLGSFGVYKIYKQSIKILQPDFKRKPVTIFPDQFNLAFENIRFRTEDNIEIKGWFIPKEDSNKTIFLMHGWGMNKGDILKNTSFLHEIGFNLVYFDFRAMGESGGTISSIGYLETRDLEAALEHIKKTRPWACENIGFYGISMGATVAIYVAAKLKNVKCIVSEATYYSFNRVVARWAWINRRIPYFPVIPLVLYFMRRKLKFNPQVYSPAYNISDINAPIFIVHGRHDNLVPAINATYLYKNAKIPKELWLIPGAKHNQSAEVGGPEYKYRLSEFYTKYM
ncbi:pimeloyl-ACP methyl ester carboxylesterase [Elusimicrobium posterum]|uniref:alpha/beta hydrolase n=1 Tax=Elusimicrobium posterum TaxID=3116653 RepID=UPI003C790395